MPPICSGIVGGGRKGVDVLTRTGVVTGAGGGLAGGGTDLIDLPSGPTGI